MSLHLPRTRLLKSANRLSSLHPSTPAPQPFLSPPLTRSIFGWGSRPPPLNPLDDDFLKKKPPPPPPPPKGGLASSSIFADQDSNPPAPTDPESPTPVFIERIMRNPETMAAIIDPQPTVRRRWQRAQVIKQIRQRGRLNKTTLIARTERQSLTKSHMLKTSVKKLSPLARQIAGKSVEDAIVQMRFSKKLAAREVLKHLEYARDQAIVRRGMGLGRVVAEGEAAAGNGEAAKMVEEKPIVYEDKKGRRKTVRDKTAIYVDQAWVGRGKYEREPEFRGRGRVNTLYKPYTSISVLLKEQATQIRLAKEREEKRQRKKVWVNLPDRPITAQRQYCLW